MTTCSDHVLIPLPHGGPLVRACVCRFLADAEDRGLHLAIERDGRIRIGPRDRLHDEDRAFVRAHRAHVIAVLDYLARVDAGAPC